MHRNILIAGGIVIVVLVIALFTMSPKVSAPTNESGVTDGVQGTEESPSDDDGNGNNETSADPKDSDGTDTVTVPAQTSKPAAQNPVPAPKPTPVQTTQSSLPYNVTVIYDGGRFIPSEITVIQGGTVRFVNVSEEDMWVASDNHPTHDRYPIKDEDDDCLGSSFDQCESVEKGGSWSFVFERAGKFGYHNHERAKDTGSVLVQTVDEYNSTIR